MRTIRELVDDFLDQNKLSILIFGPSLADPSPDPLEAGLQSKRKEIHDQLAAEGHYVRYGEDAVDPSLPPPLNNATFQEILLAGEFDMIVTLVYSPGSLIETGFICDKKRLAGKSSMHVLDAHRNGLAADACTLAKTNGARVHEFSFPDDIDGCHLLSRVIEQVRAIQMAKGLE